MFDPTKPFLSDKEVARTLAMSPSWVRKQRHLRKHGKKHSLDVDAVMVGTSPRYKSEELNDWLKNLEDLRKEGGEATEDAKPEKKWD